MPMHGNDASRQSKQRDPIIRNNVGNPQCSMSVDHIGKNTFFFGGVVCAIGAVATAGSGGLGVSL